MKNMHFQPKGLAICKISQQIIFLKWGNSKQEKVSNHLISKKVMSILSLTTVQNFIEVHSLSSPKTVKKVASIHW